MKLSLLSVLIFSSFSVQAAWLIMNGGNTIDGGQQSLTVNTFNATGTMAMGGIFPSTYRYTLTRSGQFTTLNLTFSVNGIPWVVGTSQLLSKSAKNISLSGKIPYGVECGTTETIVMKIYKTSGQLVLSNTFIIRNPQQAIPVSNFKIFGNPASTPSIIVGCPCTSMNILSNSIQLQYTGTGTVQKYRIRIQQATSTGGPLSTGFRFEQNWVMSAVPSVIVLNNSLIGTTTGSIPSTWTYFLVTLETVSGPCSGGSGIHTALVFLKQGPC